RFWTMDPTEGVSFDPASLHKYLYAAANPVNLSDPNGLMFSNPIFGMIVHSQISAHFKSTGPDRMANRWISTILDMKLLKSAALYALGLNLRPDLVDRMTHEVYEVKPMGEYLQGSWQLQEYLFLLNLLDGGSNWHLGTTYRPQSIVNVMWGVIATVDPPV